MVSEVIIGYGFGIGHYFSIPLCNSLILSATNFLEVRNPEIHPTDHGILSWR
jgi:hypothetical protein